MKVILLLSSVTGVLASLPLESGAQGTFIFNNTSLITSNNVPGNPPARGLKVALYYSIDTNNIAPSTFVLNPYTMTNLSSLFPGRFVGGTSVVPDAPAGSFIVARVCAWDPSYPTWESAGGFGYCRPYVIKGSSGIFRIGPLGNDAGSAALLTNMPAFGVGATLSPPLCEPLLKVLAEPPSFRLRIDLSESDPYSTSIRIEGSTNIASTNWVVLTNVSAPPPFTNRVLFWTDPTFSNSMTRFYRIRAGWSP